MADDGADLPADPADQDAARANAADRGDGAAPAIPDDIAALSFEDAMAELEGIVRALESGESSLESAIEQYERGAKLKAHCEAKLKQAKARIERITVGADGAPRAEEADFE